MYISATERFSPPSGDALLDHGQFFLKLLKPKVAKLRGLKVALNYYQIVGTGELFPEYQISSKTFAWRGFDPTFVRAVCNDNPDQVLAFFKKVVTMKFKPVSYIYLLSPAEQVRMATRRNSMLVPESNGEGLQEAAGRSGLLLTMFDENMKEQADRLKVANRRSFDTEYTERVVREGLERSAAKDKLLLGNS